MKVTSSRLIEQKKPILKQLLDRLLQTYSYASILMTDSKGKQYTISKQGISITENMFVELGYVAKVYDGESYGEYAFSHIDENEIDTIAEEVKNHVMPWAKKLPDDMKVKQYPEIPDEAYHFEKSTDYEVLPEELGDEEIVKRLGAVREKAMAQDEKIVEIKTACVYQIYHKLFLSPNKDMTQNVMWTNGMILGLNPHSFVNLPAEEQDKLLKEYGSQKAAEKALEEKYGEMSRHPIVKMSKSLGNVINPDEVVDQYGADTMRLYEMFMGDFEQAAPWQTSAIAGCNRFLDRVWTLSDKLVEGEGYRPQVETLMHQTIKKVGADIETLKMNTAIAQLMTLVNALYDNGGATKAELETVVQLLNPFAPHMTEELWEKLGHSHDEQLAYYPWPKYEEAKCVESTVEIAVQVNGKVKARLKVAADIDAAAAIAAAKADPAVAAALEGKQLVKEIYVKGRLVNLAVKG